MKKIYYIIFSVFLLSMPILAFSQNSGNNDFARIFISQAKDSIETRITEISGRGEIPITELLNCRLIGFYYKSDKPFKIDQIEFSFTHITSDGYLIERIGYDSKFTEYMYQACKRFQEPKNQIYIKISSIKLQDGTVIKNPIVENEKWIVQKWTGYDLKTFKTKEAANEYYTLMKKNPNASLYMFQSPVIYYELKR